MCITCIGFLTHMATMAVCTSNQLQCKVASLLKDLQQKNQQLQALQRNYVTVSTLLHRRAQEAEASQATQQLLAEESHQLKSKLEVYSSRVEAAEKELEHGSHLPDENLQLQKEVEVLRRDRDGECQQRVALQDQLNRLKQEFYAMANVKQSLTEQLQQQFDQVQSANSTVIKLKQQLEIEVQESRATSSQLHALRDVLSRCTAQQQDLEKQLAAWKARAKTAEEFAAAEQARATKLQAELNSAKDGQANNALRLMNIQTSQQQMELKLARAAEALSVEQAARADAQHQMASLEAQLADAQLQAEAAKANATAATLALSKAQYAADEAQIARHAAEEAQKTAEAAAKVAAHRLSDAQQGAAQERAIAEATQHELGNLLSRRDAAFQLQYQQQQGWRFRQLEFMTRALHRFDLLETRITALNKICSSMAAATDQQCQEQQDHLMHQLAKLVECQAGVCQLEAAGNKINMLVARVQQQWAAKQQKLQASDKGIQVLQKQLDKLEQQVSMSSVMERKLRSEVEDAKAGRQADQQQAKLEAEQAEAATVAAKAAAEAAQVANAQQAAAVAQLETKLATAEADLVSLRCQLATGDDQLRGVTGHVASANRRLQRLAGTASGMAGMLERVGALQPQDVSVVMCNLAVIAAAAARPSTASRPNTADPAAAAGSKLDTSTASRASTPNGPAASALACSSSQSNETDIKDTSGGQQLVDGLGSMQKQMQVLVQAMQKLSESYPKLLDSWQESERVVESTIAKLVHVEESLASNYTCLICMRVFDNPVAVVPCGHNYCKACFISSGSSCRECYSITSHTTDMQPSESVPAPALERLCAKHDYRLLTLKGLQSLLAQRQLHNIQAVDLVVTS